MEGKCSHHYANPALVVVLGDSSCALFISGSETPELVEPPPPISFEELQGAARSVANRVLSRPQSGMVFMEDARTAIAMWADRLTNLLGPPQPGTVI